MQGPRSECLAVAIGYNWACGWTHCLKRGRGDQAEEPGALGSCAVGVMASSTSPASLLELRALPVDSQDPVTLTRRCCDRVGVIYNVRRRK